MKLLVTIILSFCLYLFGYVNQTNITPDAKVQEVLTSLGETTPEHHSASYTAEDVKRGEELIFIGKTVSPKGRKSKRISKFFTCVSCHNVTQESAFLDTIDLEEKLDYAVKNQMPFLQGSTFKGIVNRISWYNDDYFIKYGSLVDKARSSLAESVQLCAQECSQGRKLKDWELQSILAYYQSLGYRMDELGFTEEEWEMLRSSMDNEKKIRLITSKYLQTSPATFGKVPKSKSEGYEGLTGRADRGKMIYEKACQSCHVAEGESDLVLDNSVVTYRWLKKNITANSPKSLYEIIRNGTYAESGHREYMPNYTEEKMSNQQVEDLRAYIEQQAR